MEQMVFSDEPSSILQSEKDDMKMMNVGDLMADEKPKIKQPKEDSDRKEKLIRQKKQQ